MDHFQPKCVCLMQWQFIDYFIITLFFSSKLEKCLNYLDFVLFTIKNLWCIFSHIFRIFIFLCCYCCCFLFDTHFHLHLSCKNGGVLFRLLFSMWICSKLAKWQACPVDGAPLMGQVRMLVGIIVAIWILSGNG